VLARSEPDMGREPDDGAGEIRRAVSELPEENDAGEAHPDQHREGHEGYGRQPWLLATDVRAVAGITTHATPP
jgi:hypothetical protein